MSSIGSGKTPAQKVADLIFQNVATATADTAGATDTGDGEKQAKTGGKAKPVTAKVGAASTGANASVNVAAGADRAGASSKAKGTDAASEGAAQAGTDGTEAAAAGGAPEGAAGEMEQADAPVTVAALPAAKDTVEAAPKAQVGRELVAAPAGGGALTTSAEQVAHSATRGLQQLGDVAGLAQDTHAAMGSIKAQSALAVLTGTTKASDPKFKKAITDFADGLQDIGHGDDTAGMLADVFRSTSTTPAQLAQKRALAAEAGVDMSAVAEGGTEGTDAAADVTQHTGDAVSDARAQLEAHLASGTADEATVRAATKALQVAMQAAGQGDQVGATVADIAKNAGTKAGASALAAAAALGIQMPDTMSDAKDKGETSALKAQTQRAEAKAQQQKAAAAAASEARSNATPSGSAASSMAGATGDISKLVAKGGAVDGKFKMGIIPDYDNGATGGVAGFISRTGVVPPKISGYVDAHADGSWDAGAADRWLKEAVDNNIPTLELSVSSHGTGPLSDAQVAGIKQAVDKARAAGKQVDIRFGYEMNYGGGGATQGGRVNNNNNTSAFKQQWAQVAAVVNPDRTATPPAKMIWSPNVWSGGGLPYADWLPDDPSTIDEVALDFYHKAGDDISVASLSKVMDPVYAIAKGLNIPFTFGETGVNGGGGAAGEKTAWLNLLASPELRDKYPLYQGFDWFDYIKGGNNFSISQDSSEAPGFKDWYGKTFTASDAAATSTNATDDPAKATTKPS